MILQSPPLHGASGPPPSSQPARAALATGRRRAQTPALRIAIDARYIDDGFPAIGRCTYCLVCALAELETGDEFLVLHDPRAPSR